MRRSLLFAGLAVACALSGLAPTTAAQPSSAEPGAPSPAPQAVPAEGSFALETIRVEGLERASPRVVLAASLLAAGTSYQEAELARAVDRVERLPFVLTARFRLERGSARGLYALVIEVVETRRFFFGSEVTAVAYGRSLSLGGRPSGSDLQIGTLAGGRQSLGAAGEATLSLASEEGGQLALTHYDLFGRGAVGSVAASWRPCCESLVMPLGLVPELSRFVLHDAVRVRGQVAVPTSATRGWWASASQVESDGASLRPVVGRAEAQIFSVDDFAQRTLAGGWSFDDSDDPLLPRRGRRFGVALERLDLSYRPEITALPAPPGGEVVTLGAADSALTRIVVDGRWFVPLTLRQSLSFGGRAAVGRGEVERVAGPGVAAGVDSLDLTSSEAAVAFGHTMRLWSSPAADPRPAELWLESTAELGWEGTSDAGRLAANPIQRLTLGLSVAYRNTWGLFRFGLGYLDLPEVE